MSLSTMSNSPIASPLTNALSRVTKARSVSELAQIALEKVGIAPVNNWYHLHVRGIEAETVLASVFNTSPMAIGAVLMVSDGILVRLRHDEFVLLTTNLKVALERLESKSAESLVTLTDITHGRGVICLCGPRASDVLPKLCGLNFATTKFPDRYATQTRLAKVRTLIMRMDAGRLPAYYLVVDRSLADYVWEVVFDAAQEWGGVILSQDSLEQLRK
ncbi:MAG: sarcosine oxidase subunit gamma family protein [Aggregatilineales bacterium]